MAMVLAIVGGVLAALLAVFGAVALFLRGLTRRRMDEARAALDGRPDAYGYYVRDLQEWTERVRAAAGAARTGAPDPGNGPA